MQMTLFKGLMPVNFPDEWVADPAKVRFAHYVYYGCPVQCVDFSPNGGKIVALWVEHDRANVVRHWKELSQDEIDRLTWVDTPSYIEPRNVVRMFGQSNTVLSIA